jgi:ribosome-associated translation inhibitor RaiA
MKVQLNTDHHIQGDEPLAQHVEQVVSDALARFGDRIARVEVHLADVNGGKAGSSDKHCIMEARVEGLQPIAASADAENVRAAINGAVKKLQRALDSSLGKLATY